MLTLWLEAKSFLARTSAVSMDALHVIIGVILFLLFAIFLRRSLASWLPWLAVLLVVVINEMLDLAVETWPNRSEQLGESGKDVLLTMLLPTLLLIAARFAPGLVAACPDPSDRPDHAD